MEAPTKEINPKVATVTSAKVSNVSDPITESSLIGAGNSDSDSVTVLSLSIRTCLIQFGEKLVWFVFFLGEKLKVNGLLDL